MKYFHADKVEDGWWVPTTVTTLGDEEIKIKVFVEGGHKRLATVRAEFYDRLIPALGLREVDVEDDTQWDRRDLNASKIL